VRIPPKQCEQLQRRVASDDYDHEPVDMGNHDRSHPIRRPRARALRRQRFVCRCKRTAQKLPTFNPQYLQRSDPMSDETVTIETTDPEVVDILIEGGGGASEWNDLEGTADKVPFTTTNGGPTATGELAWLAETESLALRLKNGENLDMGEETIYHVENNTGSTIGKGVAVSYAGTTGASGKLRVKPWDGTVDTAEMFMGFAMGSIANGATGYVTAFGAIRGINTAGFSDGVILYANPAGTGVTTTKPTGTHVVAAVCIAAANNGTILVRPTIAGYVETTDARLSDAREWTAATVTQSEAETGTATTRRAWTAERVRQAIVAWWNGLNKSGIDTRTSFPNADVTAATSSATANTLVRRSVLGGVAFSASTGVCISAAASGSPDTISASAGGSGIAVNATSTTNVAIRGVSASSTGIAGISTNATGSTSESTNGEFHAFFGGSAGDNRSFIRRVLGLIGWHRGSFTQTLGAPSVLTANRAVVLPDADGTLLISGGALGTPSSGTLTNCTGLPAAGVTGLGTLATQNGTFSGTSSGTNTGDETGARIAALINAATEDTAIVDADQIPLTETAASGAFRRATFASVWTWITGKLAALTSITVGGAWNFSSTTRPTSSGTGATSANSLITRADAGLEIFLNMPSVRRMTAPNAIASTGTAPTVVVSSGIVATFNSFALSSAGGARLIEYPSALTGTLVAFNQPVRSVVHGRFLPATTSGSGVARIVHKAASAPALADATDAIVAAGWGVEFYAAGGGFRARLFARPNPAAPCLYSGSGTGAGTVAFTAAPDSYIAVMLVNDGAGNLSMHLLSGQAAGTAQGRIPDSPTLTWTGAIPSGDLTRTYNPSLLAEIANASTGTAGVAGCVTSAMSSL
jgi:hypothetical protein